MQLRSFCALVFLVCIAVALAGCTGTPASPGITNPGTGAPSNGASSQAQNNLVPSPTDVIPGQNMVSVIVKEKDYAGKIPVEFDGGMGQIHVKKIEVTVYCASGEVKTASVTPRKGDSVEIQGTKQTDRVVVYITFDNGTRLKSNDVLSPYRTRQ